MKIVVNYLREVQELWEEGKIDFIDRFKLYSLGGDLSPMDWCLEKKGVLFHGVVGKTSTLGDCDMLENTDFEKTKEILEKTNAPYLSAHICTRNREQTQEETLEAIVKNVEAYRGIFGKEIALENIPYREYYRHCLYLIQPDMISKIVEKTNCHFLFDLSHARKAALHLGIPFEEYVAALPMHRVIEFHLAGMFQTADGMQIDNHGVMHEEDYQFLKEAIRNYPTLQYITLEYGSCLPENKKEEEMPYPVASFQKINPLVKKEVEEQLLRIKEIVEEWEKEVKNS